MPVTFHQKKLLKFRDITADLEDRIRALSDAMEKEQAEFIARQEKEAAAHKKRMDSLQRGIVNYRQMLELETVLARAAEPDQNKVGPTQEVEIPLPVQRQPLAEFFIDQLKERGPMTKDELREAAQAAGYFQPGMGMGRITHATLENIKRSNRVIFGEDGKFSANTMEKALL